MIIMLRLSELMDTWNKRNMIDLFQEILDKKVISDELEEKMNNVYKEFSDNFVLSMNE